MQRSETWWDIVLPVSGLSLMAACLLSIGQSPSTVDLSSETLRFGEAGRFGDRAFNLPALPEEPSGLEAGVTYEGLFDCTVYYTPVESGFTRADGYDVTPVTKPGLKGRKYAQDFLKAVQIEGFGRVCDPVDGCGYIVFDGSQWGFVTQPVDRNGKPLVALRSSAIAASHKLLRPKSRFRIRAEGLPTPFMNASWTVSDTGSGLGPQQIDCYWGEDVPLGPGKRLSRPKGMPMGIVKPMILVLK